MNSAGHELAKVVQRLCSDDVWNIIVVHRHRLLVEYQLAIGIIGQPASLIIVDVTKLVRLDDLDGVVGRNIFRVGLGAVLSRKLLHALLLGLFFDHGIQISFFLAVVVAHIINLCIGVLLVLRTENRVHNVRTCGKTCAKQQNITNCPIHCLLL